MAEEMRRCVGAKTAGMWRFEPTGEVTLVAAAAEPAALAKWPVGTRTLDRGPHPRNDGAPHRPPGEDRQLREHCRAGRRTRAPVGVRAGLGVPIVVDGSVRGLAAVGSVVTGAHAGRDRNAHQPVRRSGRHCFGGGIPRRAEEATPRRSISASVFIDSLLEGRAH